MFTADHGTPPICRNPHGSAPAQSSNTASASFRITNSNRESLSLDVPHRHMLSSHDVVSQMLKMTDDKNRIAKKERPRKPPTQNPIEVAVLAWLLSVPEAYLRQALRQPENATIKDDINNANGITSVLVSQAPKRWTVYEPMVLLPTGSFTSTAWAELFNTLEQTGDIVQELWRLMLVEITRKSGSKIELTHLAVNEGIPLARAQAQQPSRDASSNPVAGQSESGNAQPHSSMSESDNILRNPTGLKMLYGDFGPSARLADSNPDGHCVSDADFNTAFWVSTKQNGIYQTWAPQYTMFSRGNIKEKARLLDFHAVLKSTNEEEETETGSARRHDTAVTTKIKKCYAVDMYAGIGYFVFSYARLGMRVLCWELNPWSVEGLRRGAEGNKWSIRVISGEDELSRATTELVPKDDKSHIIVFLEDNKHAARRIAELRHVDGNEIDVLHVNGGLLPESMGSWPGAWDITKKSSDAWLHLHENVGVNDIETRRKQIEEWFEEYEAESGDQQPREGAPARRTARVEHVELVKTFAPGVWHCVFDLHATSETLADEDP